MLVKVERKRLVANVATKESLSQELTNIGILNTDLVSIIKNGNVILKLLNDHNEPEEFIMSKKNYNMLLKGNILKGVFEKVEKYDLRIFKTIIFQF